MSNLHRFTFLFLLFLLASNCQRNTQTPTQNASVKEKQFQQIIDSVLAQHPEAIGIMAHVEAPKHGLSWSGATGTANRATGNPIDVQQPGLIASNTKTFVATAILRLVEMDQVQLDMPIGELLSVETEQLLIRSGYDIEGIRLKHLLSHTSGIFDYVDAESFFGTLMADPQHRWSRQEQITLAMDEGAPLGLAGELFKYADTNYLLLAEILENLTQQNFFTAIQELVGYDQLELHNTWFYTLEDAPKQSLPLVYQYSSKNNIDTYQLDPSFDLYGGGGLASTTRDLAHFFHALFSEKIFLEKNTLELMLADYPNATGEDSGYHLGIMSTEISGLSAYGHGGFWGTIAFYLPELEASISVFILERSQGKLRRVVLKEIIGVLQ